MKSPAWAIRQKCCSETGEGFTQVWLQLACCFKGPSNWSLCFIVALHSWETSFLFSSYPFQEPSWSPSWFCWSWRVSPCFILSLPLVKGWGKAVWVSGALSTLPWKGLVSLKRIQKDTWEAQVSELVNLRAKFQDFIPMCKKRFQDLFLFLSH